MHIPKTDVCLERNLICKPIRPYSITITAIGMAKNTNDDNSHNGKPGGLSSIAQNAESSIVVLSIKKKQREKKCVTLLLKSVAFHVSNKKQFVIDLLSYIRYNSCTRGKKVWENR